jgi:MFS family permease
MKLRGHFAGLSSLANKSNVVSIVLVANALVWYLTVLLLLQSPVVKSTALTLVVHFSALVISAFAGASYGKKMERSRFLILWLILGIVSSVTVFALSASSEIMIGLVSLFLGFSLGFGMPACMSYFTDSVPVESRGRVSGIALFASAVGMVALGFAASAHFSGDLFLVGSILVAWRLSSLLVFLWARDYRKIEPKERVFSYRLVLNQHSFILYFVPWVMFSLINYLAVPSYNDEYLRLVQAVFMGGAAVVGGFFVDSVGRKRMAIAGFALLGAGTAVLGFSGNSLSDISPLVLYFNSAIDGISWGFLLVLFVLTLWGDLSNSSSSDKYYALGVMPFFVSKLLELIVGPFILEGITSTASLFSVTAFFLFLAVLPLVYAPETLPDKIMKKRELKIYVEKAQEIAEKYY